MPFGISALYTYLRDFPGHTSNARMFPTCIWIPERHAAGANGASVNHIKSNSFGADLSAEDSPAVTCIGNVQVASMH